MGNRVVIITGASDGLGKGTAEIFVRDGWNVVLASRTKEKLELVAAELQDEKGEVLVVPTDVSKYEQVQHLVRQTVKTFGRVDVLINSAGIDYPNSIEKLEVEQWNKVIDVNLNGVFYSSKAVFSHMKEQKSGYIINISSVAGKKGWPNATAYCASKFALTGFTQALNGEGKAHNIRCSVVYPGGMDTNWHAEKNPEFLNPQDCGKFLLHMVTQNPRFVVNEAVISPIVEQGYP
ncbi:SDR family oxidoreductase [Aquibacillus salsiterrae]|uniref:SDR family oxidoreductase n=1 Tax=Aquibacillus salsiterrae TaxID=2950439 RepID=A0A9X3WJ57_9BACI|nr:SDR family oxidoreductase [Aquibacillus salsiterrae]MDC3418394.1 SDR family oxidoreductase [Aquibacillus salsiterrae]